MKPLNSPLTSLPAWKPRPPSATLKARIFARPPVPAEARPLLNLLVPAMACMMLTLAVLNSGSGGNASALDHPTLRYGGVGDLNRSAAVASTGQSSQNHLDYLTFEWTNRSVLPSPIGFTSLTN